MALDIDNTRKAGQRQQAMQAVQQPQPKVVDQNLAAIGQPDMPPQGMPMQAAPQAQAGLPQIPAQNIATMADGGIAGYADGDEVKGGRDSYREYAMKKAQELGLDPAFVDGIFKTESNYDPKAKSKTGPQGVGQLTSYIAKKFGISPKDRLDPYKNMDASMGFMDYLNKKYKGDKAKMAVAYNQGEPVLDAHLKQNGGRLASIRTFARSEYIDVMLDTFSSNYGKPQLRTYKSRTKGGLELNDYTATWNVQDAVIEMNRHIDRDTGYVSISSKAYKDQKAAEYKAQDEKARRDF
jgi:soluble lytic murein transglycosylase-like protein